MPLFTVLRGRKEVACSKSILRGIRGWCQPTDTPLGTPLTLVRVPRQLKIKWFLTLKSCFWILLFKPVFDRSLPPQAAQTAGLLGSCLLCVCRQNVTSPEWGILGLQTWITVTGHRWTGHLHPSVHLPLPKPSILFKHSSLSSPERISQTRKMHINAFLFFFLSSFLL